MGLYRFVDAEELRIDLTGGDYLYVKKELNAGEYRRMVMAQVNDQPDAAGQLRINPEKVGVAKVLAYLLRWSFTTKTGAPEVYDHEAPAAVRVALLDNLTWASYREVLEAVEAHEAQQDRELAAKKNTPATVTP